MKRSDHWRIAWGFIAGLAMWLSAPAQALIMVSEGDAPVKNMPWPSGAEDVANFPGRLGYKEGPPLGGGEYFFHYYCSDMAQFNAALKKFAAIRVPRPARRIFSAFSPEVKLVDKKPLLVVVRDAPLDRESVSGPKRVDWTFTVWSAESFHRLFGNPQSSFLSDHPSYRQPVPPPRMDVFVGGESPIQWDNAVIPPNVRVIDLRSQLPADAVLCGFVRGAVYDMATQRAIAGATVSVSRQSNAREWETVAEAKCDENGGFEVQVVQKGYLRIVARAEDFAGRVAGSFDNRNDGASCDFDILLARKTALPGVVADNKGKPLAGIKVTASETMGLDGLGYECADPPSATSDAKGNFELAGLPDGYTQIRCDAPGYHQTGAIFELYRVSSRAWEKPEALRITLARTGVVRVKVADKDGNAPTRGFVVELEPKGGSKVGSWGGSATLPPDGVYEFKGVPPGEYVVRAHPNPGSEREASTPQPVTVVPDKTIEFKIATDFAHAKK